MGKTPLYNFIYNGIFDDKDALFESVLSEAIRLRDKYYPNGKFRDEYDEWAVWYVCVMDAVCNLADICEQEHDPLYFGSTDKVTQSQIDRLSEINRYVAPEKLGLHKLKRIDPVPAESQRTAPEDQEARNET